MDMALIAQAATLETRIPIVHFFDGFRTSHEVNKIQLLGEDTMNKLVDRDLVIAHLERALNPENPVMRGTAQNPDTYFQGRESVNRFYEAVPAIVQRKMDELFAETGRRYHLFDYVGDPQAESVIVSMGSGASTVRQTVDWLNASQGGGYGGIIVRLFRPFSREHLLEAIVGVPHRRVALVGVLVGGLRGAQRVEQEFWLRRPDCTHLEAPPPPDPPCAAPPPPDAAPRAMPRPCGRGPRG